MTADNSPCIEHLGGNLYRCRNKLVTFRTNVLPVRCCDYYVDNDPAFVETADRLSIGLTEAKRYAVALTKWATAGWPTRDKTTVAEWYEHRCRPCESFQNDRCRVCGCGVRASGLAVFNKIKMATERCPKGKWGGPIAWAYGLTTAPRQKPTLDTTLKSLAAAGFPKPLLFAEPETETPKGHKVFVAEKRLGPWGNFRRAVETLIERCPWADAYAVFQDDITLARGTREWLEKQGWPDDTGVVSLYTSAIMARLRPEPGWFEIQDDLPRRCNGALAVILPAESARRLLRSKVGAGSYTMTDAHLGRFCDEEGLRWRQHNPSLARHIGYHSAITHVPGEKRPRPTTRWTEARHEGPVVDDVADLG